MTTWWLVRVGFKYEALLAVLNPKSTWEVALSAVFQVMKTPVTPGTTVKPENRVGAAVMVVATLALLLAGLVSTRLSPTTAELVALPTVSVVAITLTAAFWPLVMEPRLKIITFWLAL